jgi:hypothetical protein
MDRILVRLIAIVVYTALSACAIFSSTEEQQPTVSSKAEVHEVENDRQKLDSKTRVFCLERRFGESYK